MAETQDEHGERLRSVAQEDSWPPMSSASGKLGLLSAIDPTERTRAPNAASPAGRRRPQFSEPAVLRKEGKATGRPRLRMPKGVFGGAGMPVATSSRCNDSLTPSRGARVEGVTR